MIIVRAQFPVDVPNPEELVDKMDSTTGKYEGLSGLIRKYYVFSEDKKHAGGIYLWESREAAEAWYNEEWTAYMAEAWGEPPLLEYLHCPIVVDNVRSEVISANAA